MVVSVGSSCYGYSLHKLPAADWQRLLTENIATASRGEQSGPDWIPPEELGAYVRALADSTVPGIGQPLPALESRDHLQKLLNLR